MGDIADMMFEQAFAQLTDEQMYGDLDYPDHPNAWRLQEGRTRRTCFRHYQDVELIHETDKAYLVQIGKDQYWIPMSICYLDGTSLKVQDWFNMEPLQREGFDPVDDPDLMAQETSMEEPDYYDYPDEGYYSNFPIF